MYLRERWVDVLACCVHLGLGQKIDARASGSQPGEPSLEWLRALSVEEVKEQLRRFKGVGPKAFIHPIDSLVAWMEANL